ncbi:3-oxo-tetronate kinase [Aquamicrobium sp. LC103]|uniref:3-oxo-tetronate kinase n=1 Tax=Aquamicrobium sp. LC103 TaxID=1120658 RepID=UPI00063EAD82|nr:3-oxo-tetronate kinase [Aquamicrobium sp. LC103]TKT74426.1 four-carbon acid sugar kinase family protein [Aquamicrobium sp. LC103]
MLLGAIADDLTGATDLALILSREGMRTIQVVGVPTDATQFGAADAVVVALKSRTIPASEAVEHSLAAARVLLAAGARQLFFKYCSTFDSTDEGNIGPVADALMELTGEACTIACPAFPANGRTVYKGHLFVGDALLSESPMRDHPLTPMRDSNLVRVLQRQTRRPVGLVAHETVRAGSEAIASALAAHEGMLIVDALTESDLRAIGTAASGMKLVTGGSAVALALPENFRRQSLLGPAAANVEFEATPGAGVILAGSCSAATRRQIAVAKAAGVPALQLDALDIAAGRTTCDEVVEFVIDNGEGDYPPLVYSSADPDVVALAQEKLGRLEAGAVVEDLLAAVATALAGRGYTRFIVAGGETSGAIVNALGAKAVAIGPEIDPGVPWVVSIGGTRVSLALKSGNFGSDDFFVKTWNMVR